MPTHKGTGNKTITRRQFYPLAKSMQATYERVRLMCQDPHYSSQHEINRVHSLPLDAAICLQFQWQSPGFEATAEHPKDGARRLRFEWQSPGVALHIEFTRRGKPTRDGLVYWWLVIEQWQQMLVQWQGPRDSSGIEHLEAFLLSKRQDGTSYAALARVANAMLRRDLQKRGASRLLAYFLPKATIDDVTDDPQPITAADVRERLRYATKKRAR